MQERRESAYRRHAWRVLGVATAVGAMLLLGFELWLRKLASTAGSSQAEALGMVALVSNMILLAIAAVLLLLARYLVDWARQVRDQNQWPPAGMQLLGQQTVRHGEQARRIAARLHGAGIGAILVAVALAGWTAWRLFS